MADDYELVDLERPSSGHSAAVSSGATDDWPFHVGVAISVYQNSGGPNNQWETFEHQKRWFGRPTIAGGVVCGHAADFWNRYEEDIQRAADLNSTCFRLSLEWCRIEPVQGRKDEAAILRYHEILDSLQRHGMEPVVTLHHFVQPSWFDDAGGFTEASNIHHFSEFAAWAFKEYGSKVHLWATFNEPNVMGFCGWIYGTFPPAKLAQFTTAGHHLLNLLRAHTAAYDAMKAQPGGEQAQIGIVHNWLRYEPLNKRGYSNFYVGPLTNWLDEIWANRIMIQYFTSGRFVWKVPFGSDISVQEDRLPKLDWIGINYYGRVMIDWKCQPTCKQGEVMTDMPYPLYAPGLYDGIKALSELGVPIYITETGIADEKGDRRPIFFETYFAEMERAVRDGYDLRGVMYWTLIDNFEWAEGWKYKFGLFAWKHGGNQERVMRDSTPILADIYKTLPARMKAAKAAQPASVHAGDSNAPEASSISRHSLIHR